MTPERHYRQIGKLVLLTAKTMRMVSKATLRQEEICPFRHIALQLEAMSHEIDRIAETLPPHWKRAAAPSAEPTSMAEQ